MAGTVLVGVYQKDGVWSATSFDRCVGLLATDDEDVAVHDLYIVECEIVVRLPEIRFHLVEHGLDGLLEERESTRMAECLRGLDMTPAQANRVRNLMREKQDGIVLASGEYRDY